MDEVISKYFVGASPEAYPSKDEAEKHIPSGFNLVGWCPSEDSFLNGCEDVKVEIGIDDEKTIYEGFELEDREIRSEHLYETWKYLNEDETIGISISFYGEEVVSSGELGKWQDYRKFDFVINIGGSTTQVKGKTIENGIASEAIQLDDGRLAFVTAKFIPSTEQKNFYAIIREEEIVQKFGYEFWYYGPTSDVAYGKVRIVSKHGIAEKGSDISAPSESAFWGAVTWNPASYKIDGTISAEGLSEKEFLVYWNDSESKEGTVVLKWGHSYPFISIPNDLVPEKENQIISGIYLCKRTKGSEDAWSEVCRTNDGYGNGIGVVEQTILALGTEKEINLEFSFQVKWVERILNPVNTLENLRSIAGYLPIPFCKDPFAKYDMPSNSKDGSVSIETGFTEDFCKKLDDGGRVITRQMMNTLGNIGTQAQFFEQCGGIWTFRQDVSDEIGGYPEDAILQFFDEGQNALRTVMSCKDNNKDNFLENRGFIDGKSWKFVDDNPTVSINVDYSDSIDISEDIFVETGIPDLYEVPYDSYLQIFALATLDCDAMQRNEDVEYVDAHIGYEDKEDPDTGEIVKTPVYEKVNGLYTTTMEGSTFLDVYPKNSMSFGSILIGGYHPYEWWVTHPDRDVAHIMEICPHSPLSGGIILSKGDKIRIRDIVLSQMAPTLEKTYGKVVRDYYYDDKILKRIYKYKFANLYRRGFSL